MRRAFFVFHFFLAALLLSCVQSANATTPPTISPATSIFAGGPTISMSAPAGTIYYTLDNSEPNLNSRVYSFTFRVAGTTVIKAIAIDAGVPSTVTTVTITIDPTLAPVVVHPNSVPPVLWLRSDLLETTGSGTVSTWKDFSGQNMNATQSNSSNQPALTANAYNGLPAIEMASSKYFNLPSGFADNPDAIFYFAIKPTNTSNGTLIDLGNGSASNNITASSNSAAADFTVYQGSTPSTLSASSALTLDRFQTLSMARRAIDLSGHIYINGSAVSTTGSVNAPNNTTRSQNHIGTDSSASSNFFTGRLFEVLAMKGNPTGGIVWNNPDIYFASRYQPFTQAPPVPIISVPAGTLAGPTQVAISTPADCVAKITIDGSTPNSSSPDYQGPINIYHSMTLKAIAIKNGIESSVASAVYTLNSNLWPAPNPSDMTPLQVNIQSPN